MQQYYMRKRQPICFLDLTIIHFNQLRIFLSHPTSSSMAMASSTKLSYQRLKQETWFVEEDDDYNLREKVIGSLRSSRFRRFHIRRRLRVKIPNLKRFLRRKARLVKVAWKKVYKRLKESQSHFGDLFAGNYLFMQVTPTPLKYADNGSKSFFVKSHDVHGLSSRYSIPRIA